MFLGSITQQQVETLFPIFAKFNGKDWILPDWLIYLNTEVVYRDYDEKYHATQQTIIES